MMTDSVICQRGVERPPLRIVRRAKGMSLRYVARKAKIDAGHLSRVERGTAQLTVDSLYRLAVVLDLKELARMLAMYVPADTRGNAA